MQSAGHAFFLDGRYCLYHAPQGVCRGAVLYVPPLGDEMNKARRMVAIQARALAAHGVGVLLIDLFGTGDSEGEFANATWDGWKNDVALGVAWLRERLGQPVALWGLRLGALLALDAADIASRLILWQPVHKGSVLLSQFLRLRLAGELLGGAADSEGGSAGLRQQLKNGHSIDIAGYTLSPRLAAAIDAADAFAARPACRVDWFDLVSTEPAQATPASARLHEHWRGLDVRFATLTGAPFWATQEIATAPALVEATLSLWGGHD